MSASTPPPPTTGNGKYLLLGIIFLLGIVGLFVWKSMHKSDDKVVETPPPPSAAPNTSFNQAQVDDVPPPPPPEPDAGPQKRIASSGNAGMAGCDVKHCAGSITNELETALAFRAKQAHRCYDAALAQDNTLQGKVRISVRVAPSGNVCSATVGANDLGSPSVANCVANVFRSTGHFPAPKGGCVDTDIPISFVPGGR